MWEYLERLFGEGFMPHGHCYLWTPAMVWLQVLSNGAIGLAYVSISATLYYIVRRIKDVPFSWMYLAFGVFIVTCGATHLLDVATVWHPIYWLDGGVRVVTAVASVGTAALLFPLVPKAIALAGAAETAHARGVELETAYRDLAGAHEKTRELEAAKTRFFANASHELRTPLTLVLGPVEQLRADLTLGDPQRKLLDTALRNARVLLVRVNDLLDVAKIEAGHLAPHYARVDLAHVARLAGSLFESAAHDRDVALEVEAPAELSAELDSDMIQRVFENLLANALQHVPAEGAVRCHVEEAGDRAIVTIDDDGPGVPPSMRSAVFERFRQCDDGTRRGGTGLGLAITKELVELHGGTITVEDAPGGGARFRFDLPVAAPAGVPVADAPPPSRAPAAPIPFPETVGQPPASPTEEGAGARALVLVVEDSPELRGFVRDTLAPVHRVETAADGVEGLEKARALRPDAVITDLMMPHKGGTELLDELRADAATADIPVLVLSARADDPLRARLLESGAQDYVVKPFTAAELRARVKSLVETKRARDVLRTELRSARGDVSTLAADLAAHARDLARTLVEARAARDAAERAGAIKANVLNLVSHELRTPLAAMQLELEMLRRSRTGELSPRQEKAIAKMGRHFDRLSGMMDNLLEYAQLTSGDDPLDAAPVDVAALAAGVVEDLRSRAAPRDLAMRVEASEGLPPLVTDPHLMRVLLQQLVINAERFTPDGGEVVVRCGMEEGRHLISVTDTGPGLSEDTRRQIFEPFWQAEPVSRKHTMGLGLGLALAWRVAERLGARIDVATPEGGRGTTFIVRVGGEPAAPPV